MLPSASVAVFLRQGKPSGADRRRAWVEGGMGEAWGLPPASSCLQGGMWHAAVPGKGMWVMPAARRGRGSRPSSLCTKRRKSGIHHCQCLGWPAPSNTAANTKHPPQMENRHRIKHRRGNNNGILTRPSRQ